MTDLNDAPGSLEVVLAGAVIESGGVLIVKESSWKSPLMNGKKLAIEMSEDNTLTITLEE